MEWYYVEVGAAVQQGPVGESVLKELWAVGLLDAECLGLLCFFCFFFFNS